MTELGVYILGATALAILAAAGIEMHNHFILISAALAAGVAYLAQVCAALTTSGRGDYRVSNVILMLTAFVLWANGVYGIYRFM